MKDQRKIFSALLFFCLMTASGCGGSPQTEVEFDTNAVKSEHIVLREPLNCPIMLTAYSGSNKFEKQIALRFSFKENPNFDDDLNDDCKGDLKKLWPDLRRFEEQVEANMPNIKSIWGVSLHLESFPKTWKDMQTYMNDAATDTLLYDRLVDIDRSTAEGDLKFSFEVYDFINLYEEKYWMEEHVPIIESVLANFDLKIESYESEKHYYCYRPLDVCKKTHPLAVEAIVEDLDFVYMKPGDDGFKFKKTDAEIGQ